MLNTPTLKPTKLSPVTKLGMLFPAHVQARVVCPQTYSLSLPLEWSQVTHIPASIKWAWLQVTFLQCFCQTTV